MRLAQILKFDRTSLPALVRIAGFVLIALAPVIGWLVFGTVAPYGRPHTAFPKISTLLGGKRYDLFGNAVFERSIVTRTVITLKYNFDYRVLGPIDTPVVVSGRDGWLFYKPEFWGGKCIDPEEIRPLLAQVDAMTGMAKAAGLDMVVSVSPDKSSVYPEKLAPAYRRYWNCKQENGELWRRIAREEAPELVDHLIPLRAAKKAGKEELYFPGDTHWTPYGAALSFRQLLKTMFPKAPVDQAVLVVSGSGERTFDLKRMLRIAAKEPYNRIQDGLGDVVKDEGRIVFAHDSFYAVLKAQQKDVFPNGISMHYSRGQDFPKALNGAQRLVVNFVERVLPHLFNAGRALSPTSPFMKAILARNAGAAANCTDFRSALSVASGGGPSAVTVLVPKLPQGNSACLRITLEDWGGGRLEMFLPKRPETEPGFAAGRSVVYQPDAGNSVALVLPDYAQGRAIKLEMSAAVRLKDIEFGERPSVMPVASVEH